MITKQSLVCALALFLMVSTAAAQPQNNTAFGQGALQSDTSGDGNSAFGAEALQSNTTGNGNTPSGWLALNVNTTGRERRQR